MELACRASSPVKWSEVARATVRLMGYPKTAPAMRMYLESLIPRALKEGYLKLEGDGYRSYLDTLASANLSVSEIPAKTKNLDSLPESSVTASSPRNTAPSLSPTSSLFGEALTKRRPLRIRYRRATGEISNRTVEIYGVNQAYFDAFDRNSREQRTFRIDRVLNVDWDGNSTFQNPTSYQPSKWVVRGLIASI